MHKENPLSVCTAGDSFINQIKLLLLENSNLVFQFCSDKVTVQAGDVADRDVLRTFSLTSTSVCTVTKSQFVHL